MYCGVPIATPRSVIAASLVARREAISALAIPKSETVAVLPVSRMLSGLMSRCTTPLECANSNARATSLRMLTDEHRHRAGAEEAHPQRLSFHERHGVIGESGRFTGGEHGYDVRVLQSRGDEYLALETLEVDAGGEIG